MFVEQIYLYLAIGRYAPLVLNALIEQSECSKPGANVINNFFE